MKNILVVLGTARGGNHSHKVADIVVRHLKDKGFDVAFANIKQFAFGRTVSLSSDKDLVQPWADMVVPAEAVIFVSPEYNHSYPGELKILIDSLDDEYVGKPAGIVSVSQGQYAGVRVMESLQLLLHTVGFKILQSSVNVGTVQKEIDEERIKKHVDTVIKELAGNENKE